MEMVGIEPTTLYVQSTHSTLELHPQPSDPPKRRRGLGKGTSNPRRRSLNNVPTYKSLIL